MSKILILKENKMTIKCFLSHSSADKDNYIRPLYDKLSRQNNTILDEKDFEQGMPTIEEIDRYLNETSLFVIFLSDSALESNWVKNELSKAKDLLSKDKIDKIYPIIIDKKINHSDNRIPDWMRSELNLQFIENYNIAVRKIMSRLYEISWEKHPKLKERQSIFVGRNELINKIEERFDDFEHHFPIALISTGLPYIGRSSLIRHALIKANIIQPSYKFIEIKLDYNESLEDFILYISDSGIYSLDSSEYKILFKGEFKEKIQLAKDILSEIKGRNEIFLIEDMGAIIQRDGNIVDWFDEILSSLENHQKLLFCIKSQTRVKSSINRTKPLVFSIDVNALEPQERKGLLFRYAKFKEVPLDELPFFVDILTGYPEQALFAVEQIKELGIHKAKKDSHLIREYASDKARIVLDKYKDDVKKVEFISFLSKFEFITYEILFSIVDEDEYSEMLNELISSSICETFGKTSEYIRINNVIKDYISRNRFGKVNIFDENIRKFVDEFYHNYKTDDFDSSSYLISAQNILLSKQYISSDMILPSVFIKVIKKLYDIDRNYDEVITLSDKILSNSSSIHHNMIEYVRFIKCQSLARQRKSKEFFEEVNHISDYSEKEFLKGFLYRIQGVTKKSEEHLLNALDAKGYRDPKIIGELIRIYMQNEEYDKAFSLSEYNYNKRPENLINVNDYFTCLLMQDDKREKRDELESIIKRLEIDPSEKAQEILFSMKSRVVLFYDNDYRNSLHIINEAIYRFPNIPYPLLTKCDISTYMKDKENLRDALFSLERITHKNAQTYRPFIKYKAILLAMEGKQDEALSLIDKELDGMRESNINKFKDKISQYSTKS